MERKPSIGVTIGVTIVGWFEIITGTYITYMIMDSLVWLLHNKRGGDVHGFIINILLLPLFISLITGGILVLKRKRVGRVISLIALYLYLLLVLIAGILPATILLISGGADILIFLIVILFAIGISCSIYFLRLPNVKKQFK
ncbi:MAG: hypothetical protein GXO98_08190 [Nitrospirae bacterium]|nr:hypothetical protein [Nitrospirota bacterium]